jgi:hypothetical protein
MRQASDYRRTAGASVGDLTLADAGPLKSLRNPAAAPGTEIGLAAAGMTTILLLVAFVAFGIAVLVATATAAFAPRFTKTGEMPVQPKPAGQWSRRAA